MKLFLTWLALPGALCVGDRRPRRLAFAVSAFALLVTAALLAVGDPLGASILAGIVAVAISCASAVKHHHSGTKLTVADLALVFSGTLPFMWRQYRRTAMAAIAAGSALGLAAIGTIVHLSGPPLDLSFRVALFASATGAFLMLYRTSGGAAAVRLAVTERANFFSGFMASLLDVSGWWRAGGLRLSDIGTQSLPFSPPLAGKASHCPDIIVIQHESVFDPRLFGLPVGPEIERFFSPAGGLCGRLSVEIYGGGSWQSEFSLLTGLSSRSFGPDAYFLFSKGAGRFFHTLPQSLSRLGYRAMLAAACRRNFMSYDAFYASIGVDERMFLEDFPPHFDAAEFEDTSSDTLFFEATRHAFEESIARDPAPRLLSVLTNFNHGPHHARRGSPGRFETERAFAFLQLPDAEYAEYYARLAETVSGWETFRAGLASRFPGRPMLVVHYGDHQPVMTRRIETALGLAGDDRRPFKTFYAIEGIHMEPALVASLPETGLDIAFLGTVMMQAAQLPCDQVFATRASLLADCGEDYFASTSERKRCFHRSLVDMGLIDCRCPDRLSAVQPDVRRQQA